MNVTDLFALFTGLGAATMGGVFFAFSSFVMRALARLPLAQGAAAMQHINVVVINPWFMAAFMGTLLLSIGCVVLSLMSWRPMLLAAGLLYALGTFGITVVFNVPRNERLARMDAASDEAGAYWPVYVREWTLWNHARTVAALASAVCAGLVMFP